MRRLSARAQQLKEWRKRCGHSQLDLGVAVRTTPRQVSFLESGGPLRGVQPDPSETGDWPDGRGAKMTGAAQPNNDLRGQKRIGDSQNLDLKGHGAAERRAVSFAA